MMSLYQGCKYIGHREFPGCVTSQLAPPTAKSFLISFCFGSLYTGYWLKITTSFIHTRRPAYSVPSLLIGSVRIISTTCIQACHNNCKILRLTITLQL